MFCKLALRNSRRNWRENGLYFSALLVAVIAFYMILSLEGHDVMRFLRQQESHAVERILEMLPLFFGFTLVILFGLICAAQRYQLERRSHEFGVYLMMGMRRSGLFALLLAENLTASLLALAVGLPAGVLCSELASLLVDRAVGLGLVGHALAFHPRALAWTALSFLGVNLAAAALLSGGTVRRETGALLTGWREEERKKPHPVLWTATLALGLAGLARAYQWGISGRAWSGVPEMGQTLALGMASTFLLFYGLRGPVSLLAQRRREARGLDRFTFRQVQEQVLARSSSLAVCSLLILAAMCFCSAGMGIFSNYRNQEPRVVDFTFWGEGAQDGAEAEAIAAEVADAIAACGLSEDFDTLFAVRTGHFWTGESDADGVPVDAFHREALIAAVEALPETERGRSSVLYTLNYSADLPHIIPVSDYNRLRAAAGEEPLALEGDQLALYLDPEFLSDDESRLLNGVLEQGISVALDTEPFRVVGPIQSLAIVADRAVTISFGLIIPDEVYDRLEHGGGDVYVNAVLSGHATEEESALEALRRVSRTLEETGLQWESYLQMMARAMVYQVPASYLTVYLALILLLAANTLLGVQFLMAQQRCAHRYRTLLRLGAAYGDLCASLRRQANWYFGLPIAVAAVSSFVGVRSLLAGILSSSSQMSMGQILQVAAIVTGVLIVIEWAYLSGVKRAGCRWLRPLAVPRREE